MLDEIVLFGTEELEIQEVVREDTHIRLTMNSRRTEIACPSCGQLSQRVHSHYWRTVADLPWSEYSVQLRLHVRRLFCDNPSCSRRTFVESFPNLVVRSARRTRRLAQRQREVGLTAGGEAGGRMLTTMAMPCAFVNLKQAHLTGFVGTLTIENEPI